MSRIGNAPIPVPDGVTVTIDPARVSVAGPLGTLQQQVPTRMKIEIDDGVVKVTRPTERGEDKALHGLTRTLVANMVQGVTQGFEKKLEIQGVGYRAALKGADLELSVGYSHTVTIKPRTGITFEVPTPTEIFVKGTDKQMVGQTAAEIRKVRPPEPYKGKGIKYIDEYIERKAGKSAVGSGS
jgi:large subunit ribosomal protein L6